MRVRVRVSARVKVRVRVRVSARVKVRVRARVSARVKVRVRARIRDLREWPSYPQPPSLPLMGLALGFVNAQG